MGVAQRDTLEGGIDKGDTLEGGIDKALVLPSSETTWMEASVLPEETVWKELSIRLRLHFGTMSSSPSVCRACFEATMAYKRGGAYFDCVDLMDAIVPLKTTRAKGWHRQLSPITGR